MKKLVIIAYCICAAISVLGQDSKASLNNGQLPKIFFSKHVNMRSLYHEVMDSTDRPVRVLFSFVINRNGDPDSLKIHESTSSLLEQEIRRVMALGKGQWKPEMRNGKTVISTPFFWVIYVQCTDCDHGQKIERENETFYKQYPYSSLPNWRKGSVVLDPPPLVFLRPRS
ncbi:energy transducer TonB [Chitinophaga qingshengii]|uniref:TonB C-terminal domain-containing protein n=1 Tax=Chitinophaga qingshengii TaxID=1569794 RepID=A0ABR7TNK1_9BACT|nr:hypothetical protein [Chitinophaga qingshengii]MBC9931091.1 hypothetical protein [Chitinophaga qingshengii]